MHGIAGSVILAFAGTLSLLAILLSPRDGRPVVVVFPPDVGPGQAFARLVSAGWRPVDSLTSNVVLAAPASTERGGHVAGAWAVLDAMGLRGCR